jgi:16S rRNA (cytosine967-C5)-methyltransferase
LTQSSNTKTTKPSARSIALDILMRVDDEEAYSNLELNRVLQKHRLDRPDAALVTEIVYGTIQRLNTIDYFLNRFLTKGIHKLEPWVRNLLRLSFYQLYYLERIPDHAAVNEAVNIAKRKGHKGISGMVNAVLRNVIREKDTLIVKEQDPVKKIALTHSHPEWMVSRWIRQLGAETAEQICYSNNLPPHTSVRVNTMRRSREDLIDKLQKQGVKAVPSRLSRFGVVVEGGGNMAQSGLFTEGDITIQDESSMLVAAIVDPAQGMKVLDCCAAPGGKTTHLAEIMKNDGEIWANDIHEHKVELIQKQADRLSLKCVKTMVSDALHLAGKFPEGTFDRILLDAPCSGLGVIRRKPDIKWSKKEADIPDIAGVQYGILKNISGLLRSGGVLVYSTCTIEREENEAIVERFLREHPDFTLDQEMTGLIPEHVSARAIVKSPGMIQILPHHFHSDGFFIARLKKQ